MKIAFFNYYQNGVHRGLETFVTELSRRLGKHHPVLILPAPSGTSPAPTQLSLLRRFFLDPASLKVALWTLRCLPAIHRFRPQVIFALNGGWQALILRLWCAFNNIKLVVSAQSGPGWDDRINLLIKPHLFVALTGRQLTWAKKATIWKQVFTTIPNGVDLDRFKPAGQKTKLNLEKPIILIVAASSVAKRVGETVRAVSRLKYGSLLFLGKGELDREVDQLGEKLLGPKRFLHLSVTYEKLSPYYRSADLFTLCSASSEAFGIVYLEAMASGLGVVATDDESRREIVGSAGLFVKVPTDSKEYAVTLTRALKTSWGERPLKQAAKFSWDKIARKYEKALVKLTK